MPHHSSKGSKNHGSSSGQQSGKHSDRKLAAGPPNGKSGEPTTYFSFLFVVNELPLAQNYPPTVDYWGTAMPPDRPAFYAGECPGRVFRYVDGEIHQALGYTWSRKNPSDPDGPVGNIVVNGADGLVYPTQEYSTFTVFNCWGPLPCVYVKADVTMTNLGDYGIGHRWHLMSFQSPDSTGVSRIAEAGGSQVVAGRGPTWAPSLVNGMFMNYGNRPQSQGLAGELPVIIGQMALTHTQGHTDQPFIRQLWHRRKWGGGSGPQQYIAAVRFPGPEYLRGVLVHVALDNLENPHGSTAEALWHFEWEDIIVRD